jgi:Lrp/AsnC family transcriptional regulator, leucine-responsive regulatory protein
MPADRKDREILFNLSLNARSSLASLSKKTRLSKEVLHYRIKNLEKNSLIEGYYAVINTYKFGKVFYRVYLKTANMSAEIEGQFIAYLKAHPKVTWIVEMDGDLDFLYVVWAENIDEFEQVYNDINDKFSKYIEERFFSVMTLVYYFKSKYLTEKEDDAQFLVGGKIEKAEMDALDWKLISLLSNEGRLPLVEIALRLKSTAQVVKYRMKRLEKTGVISGYTLKINHKALGFIQRKVMLKLNDTSYASKRKLTNFIIRHPSTIYITIAIGQYDFEFEMMETSHEDFHMMLKKLKSKFPNLIKDYFTVIFYNEPKVGQLPIISSQNSAPKN